MIQLSILFLYCCLSMAGNLFALFRDMHESIDTAYKRGVILSRESYDLDACLLGENKSDAFSTATATFIVPYDTGMPQWDNAILCKESGNNQKSVHLLLDVINSAQSRELSMVYYLASEQKKEQNKYDFRIVITQKRPSSKIYMYTAEGALLTGDVPMYLDKSIKTKKPYLPWQEGMRQFYSVVCEARNQKLYFLFIQHTREMVHNYTYASPIVRDILDRYATHQLLQNRAHAYREQVSHMRCLPVPYMFDNWMGEGDSLWITCATLSGNFEITPA